MPKELLIVNKKLLPKCFPKVVETKRLLNEGKETSVSDACKKCGISRSTFYKYQDDVFEYNEQKEVRKLVLSFTLSHKTGALSKVCDTLSKTNVSIITISQSAPIGNKAPVMLSLDISNLKSSIDEFTKILETIPEISHLKLISFE